MSKVRLYGDTSGFVELAAPDVSDDGVLTLPTAAQGIASESYVNAAIAAIPGIGSNVVQTVKSDTQVISTTSNTTIMSAAITPTATSSKVLVIVNLQAAWDPSGASYALFRLVRGATNVYLGDAAGSRVQATGMLNDTTTNRITPITFVFLDSPNTTDSRTYAIQGQGVGSTGGNIYINRSVTDTNAATFTRNPSSITVIEVAG